jgi:hypothetical protein
MRGPLKLSPWLVALQGVVVLREHWEELAEHEQQAVAAMFKRTRGRLDRLEAHEREQLIAIVKRLKPLTIGRKVVMGSRRARPRP